MPNKYAVLGSPIEHSLSPALHSAAFLQLGLEHSYQRYEVSDLDGFDQLNSFAGLSLTMPLKRQAYELATLHDRHSSLTESCNTLLATPTGWNGFNTDIYGLIRALEGIDKSRVLVLGSGATAYSAVAALQPEGTQLAIRARNAKTKAELEAFALKLGHEVNDHNNFHPSLVVATTDPADSEVPTAAILFDAIYARDNRRYADHPGIKISGLEMLFWQALAQQRIFYFGNSDQELPNESEVIGAMREALMIAVGE